MPKLNEALDADLGYIQDHTWLLARATTWEAQGLNNSALLRGKELIRAKEWLGKSEGKNPEATALQKDFVDRSVEIEKRNRRVGAAIAAVVVVALVILTTIGVLEGRRATTEERLKVATTERTIAANSYLIGDFEGARDSYKAALEAVRQLEPNTEEWSVFATEDYRSKGVDIANWLANYGQTCAQLRDYDCAEEQLNAAITVDPNGLDPYFLLADVYQVQEEVSSAQDIVQRAGEIYQTLTVPEEEDNFLLLEVRAEGKIAYSDHHYDDVINMFDMQREGFRPDQSGADAGIFSSYFLEMTYYLGRSYEGANEREKACETWQDFVSVAGQAPPTLQLLWMRDMMSYATTANNACK
ncbi:MAG: hypothetical protein R3E39_28320 [Anaerolineae bacterium]